jgi:superfamily II DNA helicase RecQ
MAKMGIRALMINADTVAAARIRGEDLWMNARKGISMLILGPEQLISKGFQDLLKFEPFYDRVCVLAVDEIHLLSLWGLAFRKAFMQIGFMRARFRAGIPIIGVTATLLWDTKVSDAIFDFLGVNRGEFYLLRRSNARHDIQILFRTLYSGIDGLYFPELAWVIRNNDKTIIFAATISLVFRIKIYLDSLLPKNIDRSLRIRAYHSINWPDENLETLELFKSNPLCQVIVSTNGLAQGNDINVVKTVIQVGEPESADMFVQKPGRARPNVSNPRAIFYISGLRTAKALKIVSQSDAENTADAKKDGTVAMDRPVAEIIAGRCKPFVQDRLYGNPTTDVPCTCRTCTQFPPAPRPADCRCSDCLPEDSAEVYVPKPKNKKPPSAIPQSQRLTKPMKEVGTARLEEFRLAIWFEAPDQANGLTPLAEFLPDNIIQLILDRFALLKTVMDVSDVVNDIAGMADQHLALLGVINELQAMFAQMKRDKAAATKASKAAQGIILFFA